MYPATQPVTLPIFASRQEKAPYCFVVIPFSVAAAGAFLKEHRNKCWLHWSSWRHFPVQPVYAAPTNTRWVT